MTGGFDWRLASVDRQSTTDRVCIQLRAAMLEGRLPPGERLREVVLAEIFGTGRSAIREALRQLVQEGLVVMRPNRGARVREISIDDVVDIYAAREAIETAAVARAVGAGSCVDVSALCAAHDRMRIAWSGRERTPLAELVTANLAFHVAIVGLARSPRLSRVFEPLAAESQMAITSRMVALDQASTEVHGRILTAIAHRSPDAVRLVREHLRVDQPAVG
ncbi:MAG TPA: GntR family transcriptional regulator [Solirubrobacteraceae bacterium]|jgi:DNA-binding GntR family transcriptional regulator|nr:GntR family transcriptional regulator [Solirubrobacteraceae bacterium]